MREETSKKMRGEEDRRQDEDDDRGGMVTKGNNEVHGDAGKGGVPMDREDAERYRRAAANLNYVSLDHPRITFASKEISRSMSNPMKGDELKIKRVLRYLLEDSSCVYLFNWQVEPHLLTGYADSDWAGRRTTRRSTSGGIVMHGSHLISHWSRTQVGVALSSTEAELNAALKMASELVGLKNSLDEWGQKVKIEVLGDSSPLQGLLLRRGTGKIKHLSLKQLWLQERVRAGEVTYKKAPRLDNPSDALTHHWTEKEGQLHFARMGLEDKLRNSASHELEGGGACVLGV